MTSINYWAIVVAAGCGKRMQSDIPKQYIKLHNKTVLEYGVEPFLEHTSIKKVVVVIAESDLYWKNLAISQHQKIITVTGGEERIDSCIKGLEALKNLAKPDDWVLDHDAARPCLNIKDLERLMVELKDEPIGGVLAYPVVDTMKRSNEHQQIMATVERQHLWHAVTPQMFTYEFLSKALTYAKQKKIAITDNASAVELLGFCPKIIPCSRRNIKLTHPEDLSLAEFYLGEKI